MKTEGFSGAVLAERKRTRATTVLAKRIPVEDIKSAILKNMQDSLCQNCKNPFAMEPEDFAFYEKIKVPPPTWCPECRLKRRMLFRNEMSLYKRKCDFSGKEIFSGIAPEKPVKVYDSEIWYSDKWDPLSYGREYDFSKPFFEQFKELYRAVPQLNRSVLRVVDSDYCNNASDLKNCYLLFNAELSEDCVYGDGITSCRNTYDSYFMKNVEQAYEGFVCLNSYNTFYSSDISESHNIYFSKDLIGCSDCFGCVGLRHKQYMIFNEQHSREEYFKKIASFDLGSLQSLRNIRKEAEVFHRKYPVKFMHGHHNEDVSGDYLTNSRKVFHSFFIDEFENSKYCYWMGLKPTKDCYDFCWGGASELAYEAVAVGYQVSNVKFVYECWPGCFDLTYCAFCSSGVSHLFGCVGLRGKEYCVLNKQYSKEEYKALVPKIVQHMKEMPFVDQQGKVYGFGEFFPPEVSIYSYNETIAQEYFPLARGEAVAAGYRWRDIEKRQYEITVRLSEMPDHVKDATDALLKGVIECAHQGSCREQCTGAFRIISSELQFLKKMNIALPRLCPNCRHHQRVLQRNPPKLCRRTCACGSGSQTYQNQSQHFHGTSLCPNEFETSYAPERPEIVYCEPCYQAEVT